MKHLDMKIVRDQLDKRLDPLRGFSVSDMPKQGWIKTMREALGMSSAKLGSRAGLGQPRISRLEKAEINPHFPALRSGHRLFQRPLHQKQFLCNSNEYCCFHRFLAQRSMCWHRRIWKGSCHEIEVLTPVVQP